MPILDQNGKPIEKEVMGKTYNSGYFQGMGQAYNPDEFGVDKYQEMYDYDDACQSGIDFMTLSVLSQLGEYSHENEKITEYIQKQFEVMKGSMYDAAEEICHDGLKCGFSVGELCLKVAQEVSLREVQMLDPRTVEFDIFKDGPEKNHIQTVKQYGIALGFIGNIPPPVEKFVIFTHKGSYGNPYGNSALKAARPPQYFKKEALKSWAIALHKCGTPHKDVQVSKEAPETVDVGGETVPTYDFMINSLRTTSAATNLVLPEGVTANYDGNPGDIGAIFENAINWADKCIYRAILIPGLTASSNEDKGGSRSLGETHFKLFALAVKRLRDKLVDCILDQIIRPLILWNFGLQDDWGDFHCDEFDAAVAKLMSEIFASAVDKGILNVDRLNDLRYMRNKIGAPEITDEEFNAEQAEKKAKAAEMQKRLEENRKALEQQPGQKSPSPELQKPQKAAFSRVNGVDSFFVEVGYAA